MENGILIAHGGFGWYGAERRSDRYGMVTVFDENSFDEKIVTGTVIHKDVIETLLGKQGKLACVVLETRESTHVGDLFRGISPVTPEVGEVIELGEGEFVAEQGYDRIVVGLKPNDGRESDWLNPEKLYRAHEQTVDIYFIPS